VVELPLFLTPWRPSTCCIVRMPSRGTPGLCDKSLIFSGRVIRETMLLTRASMGISGFWNGYWYWAPDGAAPDGATGDGLAPDGLAPDGPAQERPTHKRIRKKTLVKWRSDFRMRFSL